MAETAQGFTDKYAALTINSVAKLGVKSELHKNQVEINISRSNWLFYFWNHPFHVTRVSMRIGILSLIASIISIILAIII